MNLISNMLSIFKWLFVRLPLGFSVPFTAASLWWVLAGFRRLNDAVADLATAAAVDRLRLELPGGIAQVLIANLGAFFHGAIVIALFTLGFLVAYNASALINWILLWANLKPIRFATGSPWTPSPVAFPSHDPFANVQKIGIVLAGGGAKGAFQAGSMKAIYQFLADHNALRKVKVISCTSIGSWNALFWLADLILSGQGNASVHRLWWKSISVDGFAAVFPIRSRQGRTVRGRWRYRQRSDYFSSERRMRLDLYPASKRRFRAGAKQHLDCRAAVSGHGGSTGCPGAQRFQDDLPVQRTCRVARVCRWLAGACGGCAGAGICVACLCARATEQADCRFCGVPPKVLCSGDSRYAGTVEEQAGGNGLRSDGRGNQIHPE